MNQEMTIFFLKKHNELYTDASIRDYIGLGAYVPNYCFLAMSISGKRDVNRAELAAIYSGLLIAPTRKPLQVYSDSSTALDLLANKFQHKKFDNLVFAIRNISLVKYDGLVQYHKVKGHSGVVGNEIAHNLARAGALIAPP